jgi:hypothetical protein
MCAEKSVTGVVQSLSLAFTDSASPVSELTTPRRLATKQVTMAATIERTEAGQRRDDAC